MLKSLKLENFKSFESAEMVLGPLAVLAGTNASGKSNLLDGFRVLHAIARGYTLREVFGGKRGDRGEVQWDDIRGGAEGVAFLEEESVALEVVLSFRLPNEEERDARYAIRIAFEGEERTPLVAEESLHLGEEAVLWSTAEGQERNVHCREMEAPLAALPAHQPFLGHIESLFEEPYSVVEQAEALYIGLQTANTLLSQRFFNFHSDAMREPSLPEEVVLGDGGENLSSVLKMVCENPEGKDLIIHYVREQTLMDIVDLEFISSETGKVLFYLVDGKGRHISVHSQSDGTLRFLTVLAVLLAPEPAKAHFLEDLESMMHPARLGLLIDLVEKCVAGDAMQIVTTTHSSQLLALLKEESLEYSSVTYRLNGRARTEIKRLFDVVDPQRIQEEQYMARLQSSGGWLNEILHLSERESSKQPKEQE